MVNNVLKEVERTIEHDLQAALVTENIVGSVHIPSSPGLTVCTPYLLVLAVLVACLVGTDKALKARTPTTIVTREFRAFQQSYIRVYLCALGAEWLQDSHLFALLLRHGHSVEQVATLFAASFAVSYAWGVLGAHLPAGGSGWLGGRRHACLVCFGLYAVSALTVLHDDYATLLLGRFWYGSATALLHTVFDGWLQAEHAAQAFPDEWLLHTYQEVARYTVAVAVGSGVVAEVCAATLGLGAPFLASLALAGLGAALVSRTWARQPGDRGGGGCGACRAGLCAALRSGVHEARELVAAPQARGAVSLVAVQACFEAALYVTLFEWTPLLNASMVELKGLGAAPPYGLVFASLMASLMLGSHAFQLVAPLGDRVPCLLPEALAAMLCGGASVACLVLSLVGPSNHWVGLGALLGFEFCVGAYYPAIGHLRGKHVPYESRSAATHLAKTLLAVLVLGVLFTLAASPSLVFLACALLLAGALAILQHAAADFKANADAQDQDDDEDEEEDDEEGGGEGGARYR